MSPAPKITALCPKFLDAVQSTIAESKARGKVIGLQSGLRNSDLQTALYALGRTVVNPDGVSEAKPFGDIVTKAMAWHSLHEYGLAADLVFKNEKGEYFWPPEDDPRWQELGDIGKMFGLNWGGDFPIDILDLDHFQMRPKRLTMDQMKDIVFTKGIESLWSLV